MRNRRSCTILIALTACLSCLLLAGMLAAGVFQYQRQLGEKSNFSPPTVFITEPRLEAAVPAGSLLHVSATAVGRVPVASVELWLDGEKIETQHSQRAEGVSPFFASFSPTARDGLHVLLLRAVDVNGVVGQSLPLTIHGTPQPGLGEAFYLLTIRPGETLETIASEYGTQAEVIQELNAEQNLQGLEEGTVIRVPLPPDHPLAPVLPPDAPASSPIAAAGVPMLQVNPNPSFNLLAAKPPAAPDALQSEVKDCRVMLRWNDNADNESHYEVWLAAPGSLPQIIARLDPSPSSGPVGYEFTPPQPGQYSLWVEAVNTLGSQPSNITAVEIAPQCPPQDKTQLQVEALDMKLPGDIQKAYCYISFEGAPALRLPSDGKSFINIQSGQGDIPAWASGTHRFILPIPADGSLDLSGECLGWSGGELRKLGNFNAGFARQAWNGARVILAGDAFEIGIAIQPRVGSVTKEISSDRDPGLPGSASPGGWIAETVYNIDPLLPPPYDVTQVRDGSPDGLMSPEDEFTWFWERRLKWKWNGDAKQITGFVIFLNGAPYTTVQGASTLEARVKLPATCGRNLRWEVAATAGAAQSQFGNPVDELLPNCQKYIRVKFLSLDLSCTATGISDCSTGYAPQVGGSLCATLDATYQITVNGITQTFWGGNFFMPLKCGPYTYEEMGEYYVDIGKFPSADTFVIPIYSDPIELNIQAKFWDSSNNLFASAGRNYWFPSFENALSSLGINSKGSGGECVYLETDGVQTTKQARSFSTYSIEVFPNVCHDSP